MDEASEQMDEKDKNKCPDRDDVHSRALKKLGEETAELLRYMTSHLNLSSYQRRLMWCQFLKHYL